MKTQTIEQHTKSGWLMNAGRSAVIVVMVACSIVPATASINLNSSRSNIYRAQTIDPHQFGPAGTPVPNFSGFTTNSRAVGTKGISGNLEFQSGGDGAVKQQGTDWNGNFSPGDYLLWTNSPGQGPLILQFDTPLSQIGAQIQADSYGAFTAQIDAYHDGTLLASFQASGFSNNNGDGSAIFLGVDDTQREINMIVYSIVSCTSDCNDFAINDISVSTGATPEPGTLALFGSGVLGLSGLLRQRLRG